MYGMRPEAVVGASWKWTAVYRSRVEVRAAIRVEWYTREGVENMMNRKALAGLFALLIGVVGMAGAPAVLADAADPHLHHEHPDRGHQQHGGLCNIHAHIWTYGECVCAARSP